MPGTNSEWERVSHYIMQIVCPQCGEKMILYVGLTGDPKNNQLDCPCCRKEFLPLVPGPIVGGPFPLSV
jgi:hypothetical protein